MTAPAGVTGQTPAIQTEATKQATLRQNKGIPPLREGPDIADRFDGARVEMVQKKRFEQDVALRLFARQVEENVRMLCGQQHIMWYPLLGRYIDITDWMSDEELRWRARPVFNRLLPWFMLMHAKFTENPPIITFIPGPDKLDSDLAETLDGLFKLQWRRAGMPDVLDRMFSWLIPGGRAYTQSRVDLTVGELVPWIAPQHPIPVVGADGSPLLDQYGAPMQQMAENVPLDPDEQPRMVWTPDGPQQTGPAHATRKGGIAVDVLSPLQCIGEWGNAIPWHQKRWHQGRFYMKPEDVWELFQVEVEPDTFAEADSGVVGGPLQRMLYGTGFFGAASAFAGSDSANTQMRAGYVQVDYDWERPSDFPGMEEDTKSAGGRLTVATKMKILRDGPRPVRYPYTSPYRSFDFVRLPGRPAGSTPQEAMNPVQRAYNKRGAQIQEHANLMTDPIRVVDLDQVDNPDDITNEPGVSLGVKRTGKTSPPVEFISPPALGESAWRTQGWLRDEMDQIGSMQGDPGEMPSTDASGELVKELRFDRDRSAGPVLRRTVEEIGRMAEDWIALYPTIYDKKEIIRDAGQDNVARTIMVYPELFEQGKCYVVPDAESMLPEGRGERQQRAYKMWQDGVWGDPMDPKARKQYLELARFPHLSRAAKPGGIDRVTAEQENGQLIQGMPADQIPIYPWYDQQVHIDVLEELMKSPEYKKLPPPVQQGFEQHWEAHQVAMQEAQMQGLAPMPQQPQGGGGGGGPAGAPIPGEGQEIVPEGAGAHAPANVDPSRYPTSPPAAEPVPT